MTRKKTSPAIIPQTKLVHLISLGCPRNLVDSEVMIGLLCSQGFAPTSVLEEADIVVINTCGFLQAARQESLQTIRSAITAKKQGAKIIVTGCMAQLQDPSLDELRSEIHYLLGSGDVEEIIKAATSQQSGATITSAKSYLEAGEIPRAVSTPPHYAYVKIAEGCRKGCSYCIIPHIKGPLKSKSVEQVLSECSALVNSGCFEIILIAQDLGDYGKDLGFHGSSGLVHLLQRLLSLPNDFRLRLLYVYPDEISSDLLHLMQSDPRILPYLDMPIQHCNDAILRAMRRSTTKQHIIRSLDTLRETLPTVTVRTSLIVGFPGETDQQFEELCQFIQDHPFENLGVFSYSKEEKSLSATLPGHLPEAVKQQRCHQLSTLQRDLVIARHRALIGRRLPVMVDGYHPETPLLMVGRRPGQCPEIDPIVLLNDHRLVKAFGRTYLVEITDVSEYDLLGRVLKPINTKEWS